LLSQVGRRIRGYRGELLQCSMGIAALQGRIGGAHVFDRGACVWAFARLLLRRSERCATRKQRERREQDNDVRVRSVP